MNINDMMKNTPIYNGSSNILGDCNSNGTSSGYVTTSTDITDDYLGNVKRQNPISSVDVDNNIKMKTNDIHIQPLNNGYLVTVMLEESGESHYTFSSIKEVSDFIGNLPILTKDENIVADNL